jgi:hypothetical protein
LAAFARLDLMQGLSRSIHRQRLACAAVALVVLAAGTSQGALIEFLGSDSDAEQWRNPAVTKPLDLSGDNVYGTDGYVAFGTSPAGTSNGITSNGVNPFTYVNGSRQTLASIPSYVSSFTPDANFSTVLSGFSYENANDPRGAGGGTTIETGVARRPGVLLTFAPLFSFTVTAAVPKSFEVGLFFNEPLSVAPTWRLSSNLAGSAAAGQLLSVPTFNALFFTISNASSGEVFTVSGQATVGVSSLDISAITFDTVAPEPRSLAVSAVGVVALVLLGGSRQSPRGCMARNRLNTSAPNESG